MPEMGSNRLPAHAAKGIPRCIAALALALFLSACSALHLNEPYDARIEDGVNAYQKSFAGFVKHLQFAGRSGGGRYDNSDVRAFYESAAAELSNTILRARANNPGGTCPTARAAALGLEELESDAEQLTAGSCTVVTLLVLKQLHDDFEGVHRTQSFVSPAFAVRQSANIDRAAEIAISAEHSKQP